MPAQFEEKKAPRTLEEVQREYQEVCAALGERHYRILIAQAETQGFAKRLLELNQQAQILKDAAPEKDATNG